MGDEVQTPDVVVTLVPRLCRPDRRGVDHRSMVNDLYAEAAPVKRLGGGPDGALRGREAHLRGEPVLLLLPKPQRRRCVVEVIENRDVMAVKFSTCGSWWGTGPIRRQPGSVLLTLDDHDRTMSDRAYWHWSRAEVVDD